MKIFQISNNIVHYDMTHLYSSVAVARSKYPPTVQIVETPDYVFEGWGFDPNENGDDRFIKPTAPDGWEYDDATGTFREKDYEKKQKIRDIQAKIDSKKVELDSTDYKIIKCSEYQLAGLESPYDITELHTERQALRDEINQLEAELAEAEAKLEGTSDGNN